MKLIVALLLAIPAPVLLAIPPVERGVPTRGYKDILIDSYEYYWSRYGGYTLEEAQQICKDMGMFVWAPYSRADFNELDWLLGNASIDIGKHRVLTGWKDVDDYRSTKFIADARPHQTIDGSWGKDQRPEMWGRNQPNAKKKKRINTCITTGGTRWGSGREFWDDRCVNNPKMYRDDPFYFVCQKTAQFSPDTGNSAAYLQNKPNADKYLEWHFSGYKGYTWMDARQGCHQHDMVLWAPSDLYELLSVARNSFDNSKLPNKAEIEELDFWLGWNDHFDQDTIEFVDDEAHILSNITDIWAQGQPDAPKEERDFSCLAWSAEKKGVEDIPCKERKAFICKARGSWNETGEYCLKDGKSCMRANDCCFGSSCRCAGLRCVCASDNFYTLSYLMDLFIGGNDDDGAPFQVPN